MLLTYNGKKNRLKLFWENYELLNIIFLSIFLSYFYAFSENTICFLNIFNSFMTEAPII